LPEWIGSVRNWDYRYCWIRDATLTLYALLSSGYRSEARAWREWLIAGGGRTSLGNADHVRPRRRAAAARIRDRWLPGYEKQLPGADRQRGASTAAARRLRRVERCALHLPPLGLESSPYSWQLILKLLEYLETIWQQPDHGMWEIRGEPRHFTFSKMMTWVAFDRAIKGIEQFGLEGPRAHWEEVRDKISADVIGQGVSTASATHLLSPMARAISMHRSLLIPQIGFLPPEDPRVHGTVARDRARADAERLCVPISEPAGRRRVAAGEGVFLACSFWMANTLARIGRRDDAVALFEGCSSCAMISACCREEYDPVAKRLLGNFPQAFSHTAIINTRQSGRTRNSFGLSAATTIDHCPEQRRRARDDGTDPR
jgi:GH15 family glucan-1,4-alpha-glucosidase